MKSEARLAELKVAIQETIDLLSRLETVSKIWIPPDVEPPPPPNLIRLITDGELDAQNDLTEAACHYAEAVELFDADALAFSVAEETLKKAAVAFGNRRRRRTQR